MTQIETLTGIKGHTLRVWERRYNFLVASRNDGGIRYYTEEQLKKLINVSILLNAGNKISKVVKMQPEEINAKIETILSQGHETEEIHIQTFLSSMLAYDEVRFEKIFYPLIEKEGLIDLMVKILYPLLRRVGVMWTNNRASPAQEHFLSNLIRQKLIVEINNLSGAKQSKKKVVLFLPEGEDHEIALLFANYIFRTFGWNVIYLGLKVPVKDLDKSIASTRSDFVFTILRNRNKRVEKSLKNMLEKNRGLLLMLSGDASFKDDFDSMSNIKFFAHPTDLSEYLDSI